MTMHSPLAKAPTGEYSIPGPDRTFRALFVMQATNLGGVGGLVIGAEVVFVGIAVSDSGVAVFDRGAV